MLQRRIEERRVVVHINAPQGERQQLLQHPQGCHHRGPITVEQRQALAPASGYIGGHQGPEKPALHPLTAVGHQVDLQPAGLFHLAPAVKRAHRRAPLHRAACPRWSAPTIARARLSHRSQQPIDRGAADREQLLPHLQIEHQVTVALKRLQQ